MKPFLKRLLVLIAALMPAAKTPGQTPLQQTSSFEPATKIISFGLGFPNLYRIRYDEPAGYHHLKTSGFGPLYARFEFAAFDHVGLLATFGYATFHYVYYGNSPQVVHYDDVNTLNFSLAGSYHLNKWMTHPKLDLYAVAGLAADYQKYTYGNIPPYRSPETKAHMYPVLKVGGRYYLDRTFGLFGEAGYDGLSIAQLGFSVRF